LAFRHWQPWANVAEFVAVQILEKKIVSFSFSSPPQQDYDVTDLPFLKKKKIRNSTVHRKAN
jgi:hypothetical protein